MERTEAQKIVKTLKKTILYGCFISISDSILYQVIAVHIALNYNSPYSYSIVVVLTNPALINTNIYPVDYLQFQKEFKP
ncbi:MAG: hypothetical protein ACXVED_20675, partial [Bacteroidia bacterium]